MVFTSSGLVTHIPWFNHSTTNFHIWMLTRLECGSRKKNQQWLVCKRFSSFLWCFQGRGHCICTSPRMGRALEHSNKSNKQLLGATASLVACWEQQIRPQRTITDLAQTAIKCHHAFLSELFDCPSGANWDYCGHRRIAQCYSPN